MITVTFTELRNNARKYFDAVEGGETLEICRHGKPVAVIVPISQHAMDRWKSADPLEIQGPALSKAVLRQRQESG